MKKMTLSVVATVMLASLFGPSVAAAEDSMREVKHISWSMHEDSQFHGENIEEIAANEANIIIFRPDDNDAVETSANIGIDGRFQVSLQPGHYSQIIYCSGQHAISVTKTGLKNNNISDQYARTFMLSPQQTHYLAVDVDDITGVANINEVAADYAQSVLANQTKQTHQISRVIPDCPEITPKSVTPEPVKVELDQPVNLSVLFEFDRANILPVYNQPIEAVAEFMHKYPDVATVIEGHTDSRGKASYNMQLSQQRANAVKSALVDRYGINPARLRAIGYGETMPIDTNETEIGRQNNRRVVATVSAK